MLGHKLWQHLPTHFPYTYATVRGAMNLAAYDGLSQSPNAVAHVDAMDFRIVERALEEARPKVMVNCIAVAKRRETSSDPLTSIELNAALPHRMANWSKAHNARGVHFSTDCVFDGRAGGYVEDSPTNVEDRYGRSKALGEVAGTEALTLRTSLIGRELGVGTELLEWFLAQRGRQIQGYRNALYARVSTLWMAELLVDLNGKPFLDATGIAVPSWLEMMNTLAMDTTPYDRWRKADAS